MAGDSQPSRQQERKADTRARLLNSASQLLASRGFHAVTTDEIADRADRTTGAIYAHFQSKDGVLLEVARNMADNAAQSILTASTAATIDQRLSALWSSALTTRSSNRGQWLLLEVELWLNAARQAGPLRREVKAIHTQRRQALAGALVSWCKDAGAPPLDDAEKAADNVIALLIGRGMQHRLAPDISDQQSVVSALRQLLQIPETVH